jgi:hypothetical protein
MTKTAIPHRAIQLRYSDGIVMVTPEDEDRFFMTAQRAVEACQEAHRLDAAVRSFKEQFVRPLHDWCGAHRRGVQSCYVPMPTGGHLKVFVVGSSARFDFSLATEVANLELTLSDAGWSVNVLQIPAASEDDLHTFFDPNESIQVYDAQLEAAP